jgi:hypothetical protein
MTPCSECGNDKELRPYGKNCAMVCFSCAFKTPETTAEMERQFASQINSAGDIVVIGTEAGPFPAEHIKKGRT